MSRMQDAAALVARFREVKVVVLGDLMVDEYLFGRCRRISPEAPVPVVEMDRREMRLGGAANVANNVVALGGSALVVGVAAEDGSGGWMLPALRARGIDASGVVSVTDRPTITKTRIVAQHQQIARIDAEKVAPLADATARDLNARLRSLAADPGVAGLVISDYAKGVISPHVLDGVIAAFRSRDKVVIVDPKPANFRLYSGATAITPNAKELSEVLGRTPASIGELEIAALELIREARLEALVVTRGEEGLALIEADGSTLHIPTAARSVFDVTGAGDTVVAALTLALCAGATLREASRLANLAAGQVVGELGTAAADPARLLADLEANS